MSEPKLISPLLDGFSMGKAVSDHDGVRCYPALKENSDKKYIVKVISIPASQTQLDALLLTGAYEEPTAALEYFRELADNVEKEAAALKNLSRVEGFLAFEGWQVVPMEGRLGYEVYLLSSYRHALDSYVRRNNMTHLGAVNLGIDICTALSAARRAGWIYADLKPSNIYISENREYRIGDLGLLELEGLELAALPGKYRSDYTAPELSDDMLSPNTTLDTYALGMILYQIFNDGQLPKVKYPTEELPPPPANADYELAEIILKALDPNPADRWEDPVQMGQSLVAYMQRNVVNDVPIIPPRADITVPELVSDLGASKMDETLPGMNDDQELTSENLTSEFTEMMAQADDLILHDLPKPPVAPEGASVEQLEADVLKAAEEKHQEELRKEEEARLLALEQAKAAEIAPAQEPVADLSEPEDTAPVPEAMPVLESKPAPAKKSKPSKDKDVDLSKKRRRAKMKRGFLTVLLLLILGGAAAAGYLFYTDYYVQMVNSLSVTGTEDEMTVRLDTEIQDELLTVVCTDTYGNTMVQPVVDGTAAFSNLLPDMLYKVRVEIEGFHRLDGSTTHEYMTPAETRIASYTAVTGPEDGSVILNFTVDGPDSEEWTAVCTAEGEETVTDTFTGHMTTVTGLTVGKTYTIRLEPSSELYIPGGTTLEFTAASIVVAEDLKIITNGENALTVSWAVPEGASVSSWNVRCYNTEGYDQSLTTDQLSVTFEGTSLGSAYTVEVTAAGMTQPARASITANPVTVTDVQVDTSDPLTLKVSWSFDGTAPEGGWLLLYTIDGNGETQVVQCERNAGIIEVRVPSATYDLSIQAADGSTVLQNTFTYDSPAPEVYLNERQAFYRRNHNDYYFTDIFKTPEKAGWNHKDIHKSMYTNTFASGDSISLQMYYMMNFYLYHEDITVMFVIRDENGTVLSDYIAMDNMDWQDDLWNGPNYHYCCLTIPKVPTEPGKYSLGLYFDGQAITSVEFTITE